MKYLTKYKLFESAYDIQIIKDRLEKIGYYCEVSGENYYSIYIQIKYPQIIS